MSVSVLDQVAQLESDQRRQADQAFNRLVRTLASDGDASPEDVLAIITAAGKTAADLSAAVAAQRRRFALAEQHATLPALESQLADRRAVIQEAQDAYVKALAERDAIVKAETPHIDQLERLIFDAKECLPTLISTNSDSELRAQLVEYSTERRKLATEEHLLRDRLRPGEGNRQYADIHERRLAEILARYQEIDAAEESIRAEQAKP